MQLLHIIRCVLFYAGFLWSHLVWNVDLSFLKHLNLLWIRQILQCLWKSFLNYWDIYRYHSLLLCFWIYIKILNPLFAFCLCCVFFYVYAFAFFIKLLTELLTWSFTVSVFGCVGSWPSCSCITLLRVLCSVQCTLIVTAHSVFWELNVDDDGAGDLVWRITGKIIRIAIIDICAQL